jgi:hypothetical protein
LTKQDQPRDFNEAIKRIKERQEAPILNDTQVNVLQSGYVDSMDDIVGILERAEREKATDINKYHGRL